MMAKMSKPVPFLSLVAAVALVTIAIISVLMNSSAEHSGPSKTLSAKETGPVQLTGASWATSYGSIEELTQSADLIVLGTAARVQETNIDEFTAGQQQHSLTFTDTPVSIDEVLKGDLSQGEVLVHQTGGVRADGTTVEIKSAPLLEANTRYLLFLRNDPNSDTFVIIGGPDGRLIERGGELFSLSALYPDRNIQDLGFSGETLDAVRQEVSAIAAE